MSAYVVELHNVTIEGDSAVHRRKQSESTFRTYVGSLDSGAILQNRQQRENRPLQQTFMLDN
jgi:hypothetical protein